MKDAKVKARASARAEAAKKRRERGNTRGRVRAKRRGLATLSTVADERPANSALTFGEAVFKGLSLYTVVGVALATGSGFFPETLPAPVAVMAATLSAMAVTAGTGWAMFVNPDGSRRRDSNRDNLGAIAAHEPGYYAVVNTGRGSEAANGSNANGGKRGKNSEADIPALYVLPDEVLSISGLYTSPDEANEEAMAAKENGRDARVCFTRHLDHSRS